MILLGVGYLLLQSDVRNANDEMEKNLLINACICQKVGPFMWKMAHIYIEYRAIQAQHRSKPFDP